MDSNKLEIKESLKELFKSDKEFIAILSGEWGVGKTYFWKNEISPYISASDKEVYISLFGLNSIEEIKTNILFTISKSRKTINWFNKNITSRLKSVKTVLKLNENISMPISMEVISGLFHLLSQGDFKDIVICFDDIERMSNKIELKDFMGFLSELKEKNRCKILIILNENELENLSSIDKKPYNEIFSLYKEKIVDYEFYYKPNVKECFEIVKNIEYFDENIVRDFFEKKEIKNIRVIKQCLYHLNKFIFIKELNLDNKIIGNFIQTALTTFYFKTLHNLSEKEFEEFKEYKKLKDVESWNTYITDKDVEERKKEKEKFEENKQFENYLKDYYSNTYWYELEVILYNYLYSLIISKEKIECFLKEKNEDSYFIEVRDSLKKLEKKFIYSLNFSRKDFNKQLIQILDKNKENISRILLVEDLNRFLNMLNDNELKKKILENYAKNILIEEDKDIRQKVYNLESNVDKLINSYPELKELIEEYRDEYEIESSLNEFINNLIYQNKAFLSKKDEILIKKYKNEIKEEMINSSDFFKLIIQIINNHSRKSDVSTLNEIINELKNDDKYDLKINYLYENKIIFNRL